MEEVLPVEKSNVRHPMQRTDLAQTAISPRGASAASTLGQVLLMIPVFTLCCLSWTIAPQAFAQEKPSWNSEEAVDEGCKDQARVWHILCESPDGSASDDCEDTLYRKFKGLAVVEQKRISDRFWAEVTTKDPSCGWPTEDLFNISLAKVSNSPDAVTGAYLLQILDGTDAEEARAAWEPVSYVEQINFGRFKNSDDHYGLEGTLAMSHGEQISFTGDLTKGERWTAHIKAPSRAPTTDFEKSHRVDIYLLPVRSFDQFEALVVVEKKDDTGSSRRAQSVLFSKYRSHDEEEHVLPPISQAHAIDSCMASYANEGLCNWDHWSEMYDVCQLWKYPSLSGQEAIEAIRAGKCYWEDWSGFAEWLRSL